MTIVTPARSQISSDNTSDEFISYIEKIYGQDDLIYQGRLYQYIKSPTSGTPYFLNTDWLKADIYVRGRVFLNIPVHYDIFTDDLIIEADYKEYMKIPVEISIDVIDSFKVDNHLFLKLKNETGKQNDSYYEKVYNGNRIYLLHYSKYIVVNHYSDNSYGTYSETKSVLFIVNEDKWVKCPDRKTFLQYFDMKRKVLRKYMRRQHIQYKKAGISELQKLCEFADKQLNE